MAMARSSCLVRLVLVAWCSCLVCLVLDAWSLACASEFSRLVGDG